MANAKPSTLLEQVRRLAAERELDGLSDSRLLERFASDRDELAFAALLQRHGPMVLGVCRRLLGNAADAEDAFQATFLVLAARTGSILNRNSLGSWLYGVAFRTARRAQERAHRRRELEQHAAEQPSRAAEDPSMDLARRELRPVLDEELRLLPEKYRAPLVLRYLEGHSNVEVATLLGWPVGTVQVRLLRGRERLRSRLVRRGITLSAGTLAAVLASATVPAALSSATLRAAVLFAAGQGASVLPVGVVVLTRGVLRMMFFSRVRTVAAAVVAVVLLGGVAGFSAKYVLAGREADSHAAARGPAPAPETAEAVAPADNADRPKIVQVSPANGAADVQPITELRIRFDRSMDPTRAALTWNFHNLAGFRARGELRYVDATHEFILPVELTPGRKHEIHVNHQSISGKENEYEGFQSNEGVAATPYTWSFGTAKPAQKNGVAPRVTALSPTSDTEVSLLTPLEITFDQPMDPAAYGLSTAGPDTPDRRPELVGKPLYDADKHCFTMLARMPSNWNGEVLLDGFQSAAGVAAEPVTVKYRTLRTVLSDALRKRIDAAGQAPELKQLVERVRKARKDLKSVSEEAITTSSHGETSPNWLWTYERQGSRFAMQGGQKFLGVIDGIMRIPFRIGSDGTTCWLRRNEELISLPSKEIAEKHLLFCDPFDALGKADAAKVIQDMKLEYLGETTVRGRRCYRVRSWDVAISAGDYLTPVREWSLDRETLLPIRVDMLGNGAHAIDFTHSRINQPIPDAEFVPEAGKGIKSVEDPLTEGYTTRFLNVIDGSNGRMSVRWGMTGPKGSSSSGLN